MQVRVPDELIERIDKLRGLIPRETWIREEFTKHIDSIEYAEKARRLRKRAKTTKR